MTYLQTRYKVLKEIAINLASLGIPLSFLAGYLLGSGHWLFGVLVMIIYLSLDNITGRLWFKVLEMMQGFTQKVLPEGKKQPISFCEDE